MNAVTETKRAQHPFEAITAEAYRHRIAGNKSNRDDALKALKKLTEELEMHHGDRLPGDVELHTLANFFLPTLTKKPKDLWEWVAKAAGTDDVRYYLNYVHVSEKWIEATDGHRLHRIPNAEGIEPGYYQPATRQKMEVDGKFPDTDRVIPGIAAMEAREDVQLDQFEQMTFPDNRPKYRNYLKLGQSAMNQRYVEEALRFPTPVGSQSKVTAYLPDNASSSVRFDFGDTGAIAIVMPARV